MTEYLGAGFSSSRGRGKQKRRRTLWSPGRPGRVNRRQRGRVLDAGPEGRGQPAKRRGALRDRLRNVTKPEGPRLFVFNICRQFIRTVPVLPRDEIDIDDVDSCQGSGRTSHSDRVQNQPL